MSKVTCPWLVTVEGMHIVYGSSDDQFRIRYIPEVVYARKNSKELHLQILNMRTPLSGKKYPAILYITGSGWQTQERFDRIPQLVEIARNGYVIASMEYRNTDDGFRFPAQIEDAKTAIRFLKEHSEEYQIDVDRIAVWGDSSGAHTALMAGITDDEQFSSEKDSKTAAQVKCIIDFYGPSDFMLMDQWPDDFPSIMGSWGEKEPLHMLFGGKKEESLALMKKASPLEYITKGKAIPPVLIMHGDKDAMVLLHQSVLLYRKLRETGHEVEFYVVRNAAHGFNFWTQRTVSVVTDFLNAYL